MDLATLFLPACFALNMAPGPNNLLSVSNATRYGYRTACLAGAGRLLAFAAQRTYQSVLDEVRCALAIEFLQKSDMPMDDLAAQVGFSEAANFRKAFRKWTGQSPGDYRKALRPTP